MQVELVTDAGRLESLEADWWRLWQRCPTATPFQSPAWLLAWWRHFAPGTLFTVAVHRAGQLIGLAPFYIEQAASGRRVLPLGISISDYLDVLVDPVCRDAAGPRIVDSLAASGDWDRWDLEELPPGAMALDLPCPAGCSAGQAVQSACPVLSLPDGVGFDAVVPAKQRRQVRNAVHRAGRMGRLEVIRTEAAGGFLEELFRLHGARWQSRGEAGVLADEVVRRFHAQALPELLHAGLARLYTLRLDGRPAGVYYGLLSGDRAYGYLTGLDPEFEFISPGSILVAHAIAEAIREGAREFHFLRGREAYKYHWGPVDRWNQRRSFRREAALRHA